jgi:hypothetical protein
MLIVEDGSGKSGAEAYISAEDATAYFAARGMADWAALASDEIREQMLRRATDYMEQVYRERWSGYMTLPTQVLSWPRHLVPIKGYYAGVGLSSSAGFGAYYPNNTVPTVVANACAELALRAIAGDLAPNVKRLVKRVKVDVIETEYADGASPYTRFRAVDLMLQPFLSGAAGQMKLVRA